MPPTIDNSTSAPSRILPDKERTLDKFVEAVQVRPHFHPIVDVMTGTVLGFEVLARGAEPYESPYKMFREAARLGATWHLEMACCHVAFEKIAGFNDPFNAFHYFINVSPPVFNDPRFTGEITKERLRQYGIDRRQIVIEITEEKAIHDYERFQTLINHYSHEGFNIALDDFGSGHSGLITLVASTPHYLKLDMAIVRDVHKHDYKQKLVKTIVSFASSVNARLIAEGVECMEELEVLIRYGVRYIQGYIFGKPQPEPTLPPLDWKTRLKALVDKYDIATIDLDSQIGGLLGQPVITQKDTMRCKDLDKLFHETPQLDHIVIVDGRRIYGLITRLHFYTETGGAFGYPLHQKKPIETICKRNSLTVDEHITITLLAKLAMDRIQADLYDPVLVTNDRGHFLGSVTVKQIISKAVELEIRCAMGLNPLTSLPGNNVIHRWIHDALTWSDYTVVYIDLDRFKEYNDVYGFLLGDEMLRLTAGVITGWLPQLPDGARLGHIGGDDFVVVCRGILNDTEMASLCQAFDTAKLNLLKRSDIDRGYISTTDRLGKPVDAALVTMSAAVIDSGKLWTAPHPALFSEIAASLKKKVKQITAETRRSAFLFERRSHSDDLTW